MIILGIDPGFARTGYGIIKKEKGKITVLDFGCIITEKDQDFPDRLVRINTDLVSLLKKSKPDSCAIEDLFFFKNSKTVLAVAAARGVLMFTVKKKHIPISEYTPLQVKQAVTGYGRADKAQIMSMVKHILKIKTSIKLDDTSDALAIALCHANSLKKGLY
ncbi:MAG: crossover junction endodeoxyribonuclease RuvC [Patescibacteria group bacterium]|nr:crossover junction endodeoxyribonuclease RuvC [Patescibacteria group bacterium]